MDRRGFESPMDFEYQNRPPVDPSSPFARTAQQSSLFSSSPSKPAGSNPNPFAIAAGRNNLFKQNAPYGQAPRSQFNPQMSNQPSAPAFRNPAFTTPQKRIDELAYSEFSPAESSPALTDRSEIPDTPDLDHDDGFGKMTITPHTANRALFGKSAVRSRTPGRGELVRGNRDKIRKRRRQQGDRDVGSVRPRLPHGSDDSDSDWEEDAKLAGARKGKKAKGWFGGFLRAVSDHPSAPVILSKWLQLGVNLVLMGLIVSGMMAIFLQVRADLAYANEKARADLVSKMAVCSDHYLKNACAPKSSRLPALEASCNEWETCMNQDPAAIMQVQVTVRNIGAVLNEFTDTVTLKTFGFLASMLIVAIVGTNVGFGFLRAEALPHPVRPAEPSHAASFPMLGAAHHNPQQAYIFAPIGETPRHVRRNLVGNDASDTENSPDYKSIMPPGTPSGRRSPSKGERGRSPTKQRSPTKFY